MRLISSTLLLVTLLLPPVAGQAQAVSAERLSQALGMPGLQVKAVPKRFAEQPYQDYDVTDAAGHDLATMTTAPAANFADWKQVQDYEMLPGLGQEAYHRPVINQVCARSARVAACLTPMPGAFDKKPSLLELKAALATLL